MTMEKFIERFKEFRQFLNCSTTEWMVPFLLGKEGGAVLKVIKDKFNELGLNDEFDVENSNNTIIKDNRLVSDKTFAVRFLSYLMDKYTGGKFNHPMQEEEYEYMIHVAIGLLKHQVETCPENEKWYFENLCKNYKDYTDIIKYHICKYNDEFYQYLIRAKFI